jgi:hypothetical protein
MARFWYAYIGSGDPLTAWNYTLAEGPPGCLNGSNICAIYAAPDSYSIPLISRNIRNYISAGLTTGVSQPQAAGNPKQFVYLKYNA